MERSDNDRKEDKRTPIIDGDARPDINLDPENKSKDGHPIPIPGKRGKGKTTENRNDVNSLEDFRDARQE